jgi:hypothetical protein
MGIDGIGKPPGAPPLEAPSGASGTPGTGATFRVEDASAPSSVQTSELDRLTRGEISLDDYLDARVSEAVQHLQGKLSSEQLSFVRQTLRDELATDPVLVELVRQATGKTVG